MEKRGIIHESTHTCTESGFNFIEGGEDAVCEVVFPKIFPDVLSGIEFWAVGREEEKFHRGWDSEVMSTVPARAVEEHEAKIPGELLGCVSKEDRHHLCVYPWHEEGAESAVVRRDGGKTIDELPDHLPSHLRTFRQR